MSITNYTWNPMTDSVMEEVDDDGVVLTTYTNSPEDYGPLISQCRNGLHSSYHCDALGSTLLLTNNNCTITDYYRFDAEGRMIAKEGATINCFQWNGRLGYSINPEQHTYSVREREYCHHTARWQSRDPLGFTDDGNMYSYVANDFVGTNDPPGTMAISCKQTDTELSNIIPTGGNTVGVGITITTKNKTVGKCGSFRWGIEWGFAATVTFRPPYFILQHTTATIAIQNCAGNDVTDQILKEQLPNLPLPVDFWEAWQYNGRWGPWDPNSKDTFGFDGITGCTKGRIVATGQYGLVKGKIPKPPFKQGHFNAGKVWATEVNPKSKWTGPPRIHSITATWDCCQACCVSPFLNYFCTDDEMA